MASFRNVFRILGNPALTERVYGAILCKVRAVHVDPEASVLQRGLAYAIFTDQYPQAHVTAVMRAIASHPDLQNVAEVTETGSVEKGNVSFSVNTESIADAHIAAVVDACWTAFVEQRTPQKS